MARTITIAEALAGFPNYLGAQVPQDPSNQAELSALEPSDKSRAGSGQVWEGTAPTWDEVVAKQTELQNAENERESTKISAYEKLGLTEAEINAIL